MRDIKWILGAMFVGVLCFAADAANNPDPFNIQRRPVVSSPAPVVVQAQPAPIPTPAPVASTPAPASGGWLEGLQNWINTALLALISGLVGKGALWPARTPVVVADAASTVPTTATELLKSIKNPSVRAEADKAIFTIVHSGIVGEGIKTAAGLVPGAGIIAQYGEPLLRQAAERILQERLAANQAAATQ